QIDGRLSGRRARRQCKADRAGEITAADGSRKRNDRAFGRDVMRELVAKYLSKGISRRGFVSSLTKAGLTMTAAQSVLSSVSSVSRAQVPAAPAVPGAPAAAATSAVQCFQRSGG